MAGCECPLGLRLYKIRCPLDHAPPARRCVACPATRQPRQRVGANAGQPPQSPQPKQSVQITRRSVSISSTNWSLAIIKQYVEEDVLELNPEFQRDYVWNRQTASQLIVTVILGLIVPPIIVYKKRVDDEHRYEVVDGKQRLVTLVCFMQGRQSRSNAFPAAPTELELDEDDEYAEALNGKCFEDLPADLQRSMKNFMQPIVEIGDDTSPDNVFRIYESINTGSQAHSAQQLRRAAFHGNYIRLLEDLSRGPAGITFKELAGIKAGDAAEKKQEDQELILRFFALRDTLGPNCRRKFSAPMKKFLNDELQAWDEQGARSIRKLTPAEEDDKRRIFQETVDAVKSLGLKGVAVKALGGDKNFAPGKAIWDTTLLGVSMALASHKSSALKRCAARLHKEYEAMLRSSEWAGIKVTHKSIQERQQLFAAAVERAMAPAADDAAAPALAQRAQPLGLGPRAFSKVQVQQLYARDSTCAWCGEPIVDVTHGQADHVVPYSRGGQTRLHNGAMLHTLCNQEKGARPLSEGPLARRRRAQAAQSGAQGQGTGQAHELLAQEAGQ